MKSLLLIRHAKSSWDSPTQTDFDRPLNERGHKDAQMMAKRLIAKKIKIDAFVTSPATRASSTANYFLEAYNQPAASLVSVAALYHAAPPAFYNLIGQLNNKYNTVALFAHNPGITEMASSFDVATINQMPTCSIFGISINTTSWQNFEQAEKRFWMFDYPKSQNP